jgi:C4-dicarboxylate transporter, DctM subunit
MSEALSLSNVLELPQVATPKRGIARAFEDYGLSVALLLIVILPLAEIVLRRLIGTSISGSAAIVQHLTLVISMLGAAVAARESRLLSMAAILSGAIAASTTAFLALAGFQFVSSERASAKILAYSVPVWAIQLVLPLGFSLIAIRLIVHSSDGWRGRLLTLSIAAAFCVFFYALRLSAAQLAIPALIALLGAAILGAPIFVVIGGVALVLFWREAVPIAAVVVGHYSLVVNPSLPAIPLFTLAGYLLAEGGASRRLVDVFEKVFGAVRGGPAIVTALACAFFTTFTGGSGVTILALGGLLFPLLRRAGYSDKDSLGLITGAGSLGLLFPPCLPLILYAIVAQVRMEQMFLGGILPGILLLGITAWWGVRQDKGTQRTEPFSRVDAGRAIWRAKWELLLPIFVIVVLFGGFATPVETAAFTALYAFVVEAVIYRDLRSVEKLSRVFTEAGLLIGGVLLILGVALGFTNFLIDAEVPAHAVEWVTASIHSPLLFLLLLNVFLLVVGGLMDIFPAIVVVVPLIVPIGAAFHIDPTHLGIIFLANMELGFLMPPVGLNLLISSYRFGRPMTEVARASLPMLLVLLAGVLLITYVPALTTALPHLFLR